MTTSVISYCETALALVINLRLMSVVNTTFCILSHSATKSVKFSVKFVGYPNNFLNRCIQQFSSRKHGVRKRRDAPAEPSPSPKYISLQLPYLVSVSHNIRQEVSSFIRHKAEVNVKLRCFQNTQKLQSWFSIKDRQAFLNRHNVIHRLTCSCGAFYIGANATQFNKSYRRASNVTKLFSLQTLARQPRSSGWLSQPRGRWQWQQLAAAVDSWIFIDSKTQTRAECKHPIDASVQFKLVTELHASLMTSRAMTIGSYPIESCDYACFSPLRHHRNSPSRFSFFTARFSWLAIKTCSMIFAVQFAMCCWWQ